MESARIKSVPKPQIQLGEMQESGIKMRTIPAVIRKIPIPPCLGPPAKKTATNSAAISREKASSERSRHRREPDESCD
jgi:hypothetical protein